MKSLKDLEGKDLWVYYGPFSTCGLVVANNEEDAINKVVEYYRKKKFNYISKKRCLCRKVFFRGF